MLRKLELITITAVVATIVYYEVIKELWEKINDSGDC